MPRTPRRRTGTRTDEVSSGRRHLAAIDPAVMRRVVGRPRGGDAGSDAAKVTAAPAHRRD